MTHYLKIDPFYLNRLIDGNKTFEVRKNDRDFQEGDILILREWHNSKYLEREVTAEITYVLRKFEGLKEGYVVLGIKIQKSVEEKVREQIEIINREIKENVREVKVLEGKRKVLLEKRERLESLLD